MTTPASAVNPVAVAVAPQQQPPHDREIRTERFYDTNTPPRTNCVFKAFFCVYQGFSTQIGCRGRQECCCWQKSLCFEAGRQDCLTVGVACGDHDVDDNDTGALCRIGLGCCEWTLRRPRTCCAGAWHLLCCMGAGAFPLHKEYLAEPVFALYCVQCCPDCAVAAPTPPCPALYGDCDRSMVAVQTQTMAERRVVTTQHHQQIGNTTATPVAVAEVIEVLPTTDYAAVDQTPLLQASGER
mmetsp:Transcript_5528/g.15570  ORF Transcript_5528/g.15570 Transcript_5528/m.15570 type:complete len:240 (+) Transcript_5528:41-760(+)